MACSSVTVNSSNCDPVLKTLAVHLTDLRENRETLRHYACGMQNELQILLNHLNIHF